MGVPPAPGVHEPVLPPLELDGLSIPEQVKFLRASAIELGERLVREFPQSPEAHVLLGNTWRQLGQSSQSLDCWQQALTLDPQRTDVYTYMAVLAEEKGDAEQALEQWDKVLLLKPALPGLRDSMAHTLMTLNRWDEAIEILHEEEKLSPQSARTHYLLGRAYAQQKKYADAVSHYRQTVALDPNGIQAYYELSTALLRSGQQDAARHNLHVFKEKKKSHKEELSYGYSDEDDLRNAKQTLAGICMGAADVYQSHRQDALMLALLERVVYLKPEDVAARRRLAARYQSLGRLSAALDECEQIARRTPEDPTCQMLIGSLSLRLGRPARAVSAYQKMIALAPTLPVGYYELAKIYLETGQQISQARILAQEAVQLAPKASHYYLLGLAHQHLGDTPAARQALQQALQLDPGNRNYQRALQQLSGGR